MSKNTHVDDVAFIRALAELLRENDLTELQVKRDYGEDSTLNVRVSRHLPSATVPQVAPNWAAEPTAPPAPPARETQPAGDPSEHPGAVPSPMVGTVYMQSEPGAEPFIGVGAKVSEGQTLVIIEAMKTMNQIPSPRSGTITRILVEDGSPVEYGAPLVIIE